MNWTLYEIPDGRGFNVPPLGYRTQRVRGGVAQELASAMESARLLNGVNVSLPSPGVADAIERNTCAIRSLRRHIALLPAEVPYV